MLENNREPEKEDEETEDFESSPTENAKVWLQENLRVVVSVFIVAAIALGIYSYSGRPNVASKDTGTNGTVSTEETTSSDTTTASGDTVAVNPAAKPTTTATVSTENSKETDTAFVETAIRGEGRTHLARRALADYLAKNADSSLTGEHKVYIEDYLRKNAGGDGVKVGTSVEFSKDLIATAITKAKTLNERQLNNLKKYSSRVAAYQS